MKAWLRIPFGRGPELQNEEEVENLDHGMITIFRYGIALLTAQTLYHLPSELVQLQIQDQVSWSVLPETSEA